MPRLFYLTVILFAAFVLSSTQLASSNPATKNSKYSIVQDVDMGMPVCYFRTEDGRVLDLGNLCGEPINNSAKTTANAEDVKRLIATKECSGCNLSGANLAKANLYFADLTGANLAGANLAGANLVGANLNDGNLANANLNGAKLNGARLMGANLNGASLANANLLGANIINANLNGAQLNTTKMPDGKIYK